MKIHPHDLQDAVKDLPDSLRQSVIEQLEKDENSDKSKLDITFGASFLTKSLEQIYKEKCQLKSAANWRNFKNIKVATPL